MKELLENLEDGIALLNHEGRVVYMNKFLRERLGKTSNNGYYYETFRSIDLIGLIQETLTKKEPLKKIFTYKERTYKAKTFFSKEGVGLLVKEVSENYVKKLLSENEFISVIGHESTAKFLSKRLGIEIKANRVEIKLEPGDLLIVAQLCKRLPEGEILSEKQLEQIHIKYFIVFVR